MNFLVTGGAGFIGSHTVDELVRRGISVSILDDFSTGRPEFLYPQARVIRGCITDPDAVSSAMEGCSHVIHLAARPGVGASCADPIAFDRINVHGTVVVMQTARKLGVKRLVFASSASVYGPNPTLPSRENDRLETVSPYAASKYANEIYAHTFAALGLPTVGLRYFNVIGTRQAPENPYSGVLPIFIAQAIQQRRLIIHGDGLQTRDFVSVEDVAAANVQAALCEAPTDRVFNIGTGRSYSVLELASAVERVLDLPCTREHHPPRTGDVRESLSDPSRARDQLGWVAMRSLEEELERTIRWYAAGGMTP